MRLLLGLIGLALAGQTRFAILGDRTGETGPGIYEQIWTDIRSERPAFVISPGDTIQGMNDATAEREWQEVERIVTPQWWPRLFLAPGNHDIWSDASLALYEKHSGRARHYSFDQGPIHFTVLDNSRSDRLPPEEVEFLERDLKAHASQKIKFVVSHRPSWLFQVMLRNPDFPLHALARKYGINYVIAGHVHQMMRAELEGVNYISVPSAGGHLRGSMKYEDGWFYGHAMVTVSGSRIQVEIREAKSPHGAGRVTQAEQWGIAGLATR